MKEGNEANLDNSRASCPRLFEDKLYTFSGIFFPVLFLDPGLFNLLLLLSAEFVTQNYQASHF